jgi:hypothetical protein
MPENKKILSESSQAVYRKLILQKRNLIISDFNDLERFMSFTLSAIESEIKSEKESTDKLAETEEYVDGAEYVIIKAVLERHSLNSFVVILFSFIEDMLNKLCDPAPFDDDGWLKVRGIKPLTLKYTDMKGEGVKRAKLYLEKVIGLNLHVDKQLWSEIDTLRKIRNSIVHNRGETNDEIIKNANIKQHVEKGRLYISNNEIEICSEYLEFILPTVLNFFQNIE